MNRSLFIAALALMLFSSCYVLPPETLTETKIIPTPYGPEDVLVDSSTGTLRILASCSARRKTEPDISEIAVIYPNSDISYNLVRVNEPGYIHFNPHGFDLCHVGKDWILYVVSHDDQYYHKSYILKYRLEGDSLFFLKAMEHPLIISPNGIFANEDGSFYFSNDAGSRNSKMDLFFGLKHGSIIYGDGNGNFTYAARKLAYPNGIYVDGSTAYVATTRQNKIFAFTVSGNRFTDRKCIASARGWDNLRPGSSGIIAPAHLKIIQFARHFANPMVPSPSVIYAIDPKQENVAMKDLKVLYSDKGTHISMCSTAAQIGDYLYLGQVLEPFVLKVKLPGK